ncbi:MAG: LysR family transcriptional regulator [Devosia sp.]|nr:LysR family transcriptional regulator [Devosia sp.]
MPDLSLDLRYLRYVFAVAEQGSFRQAAAKLDLPQSTVSRRVAQLERRLGVSIFDRAHTGARLTLAGQRFVDEALVGAQHLSNAVGALHAMRRGRDGTLRLGVFTSLRNRFLLTLIDAYHQRYPEIDCHFEEGTAQDAVGGVLDGRLDVAFVTGKVTAPGCQSAKLGEELLYLAERRRDPVPPGERTISLEDLRDQRFIVTRGGRGPNIEEFILSRLILPGFRPDIQVHDVSLETLLHMVELGFGVAVVSEAAIAPDGPIAFRALAGEGCSVSTSAVWLTSNTNPALRPMISLARELAP